MPQLWAGGICLPLVADSHTCLIEMLIAFPGSITPGFGNAGIHPYTAPKFATISMTSSSFSVISRVTSASQGQPSQHRALLGNTSQPAALRPAFRAREDSTARTWWQETPGAAHLILTAPQVH